MLRHRWTLPALAALTLAAAGSAQAAVGFKTDTGWEASFDGFVNAFAVNQFASDLPTGTNLAPDLLSASTKDNTFRLRTGLLPGLFAFNAAAPDFNGLKVKARIGLYPQIQTNQSRVIALGGGAGSVPAPAFGSQIDLREAFFTVDGGFGQVLAGRALNLFQGKNILTDMTLFGVGVQGNAIGNGGTTAGRIGYGYNYTSFGAQFRYTTPDLSGFKLAVQVGDPNTIDGLLAGGPVYTDTRLPEVEAELSYAGKSGDTGFQAWVSGLAQTNWLPATETSVTALGGAGGLGVNFGGLELLGSGFYGQALGSFFMLQLDALDAVGKERTTWGALGQAAYKAGSTKLGVSYGQNKIKETSDDATKRAAGAVVGIDTRRSATAGLYHDVNAALKLVAEYTWVQTKWFDGTEHTSSLIALGGFVFW
ncbi:MAG TPA: porin [Anaeromyxobacteraceae bacterium]|nr:porin [Anaeromyxobacteraceae bacterium]